jgi:hypothetical protein
LTTEALKIAAVLAKLEGKELVAHCPVCDPRMTQGEHVVDSDYPDTDFVIPCEEHFPLYIRHGWREVVL